MTRFLLPLLAFFVALSAISAEAELKLPAILSDHMVLQRDQPVCIWGWAGAGEEVLVAFAEQTKRTTATKEGTWKLMLDPMPASTVGRQLAVASGSGNIVLKDILVGEVWVCSGQSNMEWSLNRASDANLEILAANYPLIRHCKLPRVARPEPQDDAQTAWTQCSSDVAASYTAVGYFFGRNLHQTLKVPVGLVNTSWGGTPSEAWTRSSAIEKVEGLKPLMKRWNDNIAAFDQKKVDEEHKKRMDAYEKEKKEFETEQAKIADKAKRKKWTKRAPSKPRDPAYAHHRPGNIYNGMIHPILNLTFKGAIWYQGESNQSRAYQYRTLFPLMIESWREDFDNGEFPFYFVQIANFRPQSDEPGNSSWAEVREAQAMTLQKVKKTGQACIIDIGMGTDIHPPNKQDVGDRLSRLALHYDYGFKNLVPHGPHYKSHEIKGDKVHVTFDVPGSSLEVYDRQALKGFAIAGEDKTWHWADAKVTAGNKVEVWHKDVKKPVAVRYGWADNPDCNLFNRVDLPTSPFRTDDWEMVTRASF